MLRALASACALALALVAPAGAQEIRGQPNPRVAAAFDILRAEIRLEQSWALFRMELRGQAGAARPPRAAPAGPRRIFAYVWPTSIEPSAVGFDRATGTLALAVTAHPDFDDTPLFDENADGNPDNDGGVWHVHWLVLIPDDSCGRGALKVRDISARTRPPLPRTWPGPPVLIDSPGYSPRLRGTSLEVRVPFADLGAARGASFDGFTAELRMNAAGAVPLLCVAEILDSASGNLSLPGRIQ